MSLKPRFDVSAFEELISRRGRPFTWERARKCPCWDTRTRSPLAACPLCHGLGWQYTLQGSYRATILGITSSKRWARFGEWLEGDAVMTFPSALLIGDKDRITLTNGEYRESAVLTIGNDVLPEPTVFDILECGDQNRTYKFGQDFVLEEGSQIVWKGLQPAPGTTYSVLYRARPVYVVWQTLPQIRAQVQVALDGAGNPVTQEMPKKVALRRWLDFARTSEV